MKNHDKVSATRVFAAALLVLPGLALAFSSGSTGADGAFNPAVNTVLQLPPSGVFNFTSVNIPEGVTVTFKKNTTNTPVVILASGDITVAGTLSVRGTKSADVGPAGDGNQGDDGLPGLGGPGGFDGGRGGKVGQPGGGGLGPGGGGMGLSKYYGYIPCHGGGGGFGSVGEAGPPSDVNCGGTPGPTYGSSLLLPLIGGSGGGGGFGGNVYEGVGGGGGGGAILLAASGTVTVTGGIHADGGAAGGWASDQATSGGRGGGGSGGAIRIIAPSITGNGPITATGGIGDDSPRGGAGRIRLEADTITRTAATDPVFTTDAPGSIFVAGFPSLVIGSVAGVAAPSNPTGNADITLPATTTNPVTVVFKTTNVPVGNTVTLTLVPAYGEATTVVSPALTGTTASATASVSVNLPVGPSTLQARTTYTIVAAVGDLMRTYAGNERVERVELIAGMDGKSRTDLITVTGKRYAATPEALAVLGSSPAFLVAKGS